MKFWKFILTPPVINTSFHVYIYILNILLHKLICRNIIPNMYEFSNWNKPAYNADNVSLYYIVG